MVNFREELKKIVEERQYAERCMLKADELLRSTLENLKKLGVFPNDLTVTFSYKGCKICSSCKSEVLQEMKLAQLNCEDPQTTDTTYAIIVKLLTEAGFENIAYAAMSEDLYFSFKVYDVH